MRVPESVRHMSASRVGLFVVTVICATALAIGLTITSHESNPSTTSGGFGPPADLKKVGQRLETPNPLTVTVIGDSTGNGPDEWVYLMAQQIAKKYDRTITIHNWSIDTNNYVTEQTIGRKNRPPVTIWNGSASGKNPTYSAEHWHELSPEPADLTFISHGLNEGQDRIVDNIRALMDRARVQSTDGLLAIILQSPRQDSQAVFQQQLVSNLRSSFKAIDMSSRAALIDVNTAFLENNPTRLLKATDRVHPNSDGERLWALTVENALGAD